jgi:hypothetical protein
MVGAAAAELDWRYDHGAGGFIFAFFLGLAAVPSPNLVIVYPHTYWGYLPIGGIDDPLHIVPVA